MNIGIALLFLVAATGVAALYARGARRRRTRAVGSRLDLHSTLDPFPAGLKHLGARLNEPLSGGLRLPPPRAAHSRLGDLIGLH